MIGVQRVVVITVNPVLCFMARHSAATSQYLQMSCMKCALHFVRSL